MPIDRPIFVVGVGRSGSTIFHDVLSHHPRASWLSVLCERHPRLHWWNQYLMKLIDLPLVGDALRNHYHPAECYNFWEYYCRGFRHTCRDLLASDVTAKAQRNVRRIFPELVTSKRDRMIAKITGWPRIGYLREMFPDARFIHIMRDGRAVTNSIVDVDWWWGWRGPQNWRWGELNDEQKAEWESYGRSYLALAAIEWKMLMATIDATMAALPAELAMTVKYETFCTAPMDTMRDAIDFCGLEWTDSFAATVDDFKIRSANDKWRTDLTSEQQALLCEILAEPLGKYGYT